MKQFELKRVKINAEDYLRKNAKESHTKIVYDEPGIYTIDDKPAIIYGRLDRQDRLLYAMHSLGYTQEVRTTAGGHAGDRNRARAAKKSGLGKSTIFGFRPPGGVGLVYASASSTWEKYPVQHQIICDFGKILNQIYQEIVPETAKKHSHALAATPPHYILPGTRFTSGIVNQDNPLRYHFDKGNVKDVMSCMAVFRKYCEGGWLSIPEFDARWLLDDHTYFLFDGQKHLHGVTELKKMNSKAYRYSIVFYSLRGFEKCGTLEEECAKARKMHRLVEKRRL